MLVFWEEEWLVGGDPFTWNFGSTDPRWSEIADFEPIFARSSSALTPSETSSINTNRNSTTRFPTSLWWSSYVAPKFPKRAQKRKKADFRVKSHFARRKSATKFLCVKTVSGKVVINGLTNRAKMIGGGDPSPCTWNFRSKWPRCSEIANFRPTFARSASTVTPSEKKFN